MEQFFCTWQGLDAKMRQRRQKSVKTSGLEDQYAVIVSLELWPEEPHEVHFSKRIGVHKSCRQKMKTNNEHLAERGSPWLLLG